MTRTTTAPAAARGLSPALLLTALAAVAACCLFFSTNARAQQSVDTAPLLTGEDVISLVSPLALYPDDLVAIMLPAATYPLQIVEASRFLEARAEDPSLEPDPDWDDAIIALLNYPEALALLNEDLDWTWQLGEAVLAQQADVLEAIEVFRDRAYLAENLRTDERQIVERDNGAIRIRSADPEIIYVPYYNPVTVVYRQPRPAFFYHVNPYPVYYHPYGDPFFFGRPAFFGVSTLFSIHWSNRFLHLRYFDNRAHPFYGRFYHPGRFYRIRSAHDYRVFRGNRFHANRGNNFRWYPSRVRGVTPRGNRFRVRNREGYTLRYANAGQSQRAVRSRQVSNTSRYPNRANQVARYDRGGNRGAAANNRRNGNNADRGVRTANSRYTSQRERRANTTARGQVTTRADQNRFRNNGNQTRSTRARGEDAVVVKRNTQRQTYQPVKRRAGNTTTTRQTRQVQPRQTRQVQQRQTRQSQPRQVQQRQTRQVQPRQSRQSQPRQSRQSRSAPSRGSSQQRSNSRQRR